MLKLTTFTKESCVLRACSGAHLKHHILQAGSLSCGPMNSSSLTRGRNAREVKDEVPHLSIEDVGRSPVQVRGVVWIAIYEPEAGESRCCLEHWR